MSQPMLQVEGLTMRFGGLTAVDNLSLNVNRGEIVGLIGPNGAGKTTAFNCISGFYRPTAGSVALQGEDVCGRPSHQIARRGLVRTFQNIRLFDAMTVVENLMVAQHSHINTNLLSGLLRTKAYKRSEQQALERAMFWLERVGLEDEANREAGTLAYGQQRHLEIARCMVTQPQLLLLDEPAAGLNPNETSKLDQLIVSLRDEQQITVLLIEHDMALVMGISDQIVVMDQGQYLASGTPAEVRSNEAVIKAYLGEG